MLWLDAEAVRNFVMVAELQSFTRAADAMGSTQAAVSVKLKRLEERVGRKLIERTPRRVRLSADGALFIESARSFLAAHDKAVAGLSCSSRRFTLGIAGHVAGPEVTTLLARLSQHDPALTIEVQVDNSTLLLDAFDRGELDAAIVRREDDRRDGEVLGPEHFGWYATPEFDHRLGEPIRLATLSRLCGVRDLAIRTLDDAGIPWVEVFVGGGSSLVTAAVSAGLATAVFPSRLAPPGTVEVSRKFGLPDVPATEIVLHSSLTDRRSREALRILACAFHEHRAKAG